MSEESTSFLREAICLATNNVRNGGGPFGAIVVKDGKIVGRGVNRVTSNHDPTAHAEVVAIRDACRNLKSFQLDGCVIYSSCEPCPMCLGAIYWARLEKVIFAATKETASEAGFDDGFIYREIALSPEDRQIPFLHYRDSEHSAPFEEWISNSAKTEY